MEYYCPACQKIVDSGKELCPDAKMWFSNLHGKKLWRIRFLNLYAYQYVGDDEFQQLAEKEPLVLSDVANWEDFDENTLTGVTSQGNRASIFS